MDYQGEHLLPGQIGHFFIVLSLVASLVATFSYFKSARAKTDMDGSYWKKLARYSFLIEAVSVFAVFGCLLYIISNHLFEYKYAWQHSSKSLEPKYLLASLWGGQEGSFLLWDIWHVVIGLVLIKTSGKWEAPVMTVVSFAQLCLATMIVGLYVFGNKIGSNPFTLLRESGLFDNAPGMHVGSDPANPIRPDYMSLSVMQDGNDLNVLLQNYWMVIHPPVLFLGFASTIVPFAFAFAGMWKKQFSDWIRPALPWSLFSAAVLGVGIMMGAAWAYESLTFGGYWAWDPVENASLVPWLILIAGIHTLLIYKHSGYSLRSAHLFFILAFGFILYSTFLTRTGILGDTSVHAFTGEGKSLFYHLQLFMGAMLIPAFWLFFKNYKKIPSIKKEESASSREFWMFIGSLVFFLAAMVVIAKTSVPVLNKITEGLYSLFPSLKFLNKKIAAPEDSEFAYNQIQVFVAIIIALLTGFTQYLKYKTTSRNYFWQKFWLPALLAFVIASVTIAFGNINYDKHGLMFLGAIWLALACSIYTVIANAAYIWIGMKGKLRLSGGSVAHAGFGLVLAGILISSSKKEILSYNTSGIAINFGEDSKEKTGENLTLVKGLKNDMGKYWVTYEGAEKHPEKEKWFFNIHFEKKDGNEEFMLVPSAFVNARGNEGLQSEPDSRHYWDHDVFTYVTALPDPEKNRDTANFRTETMKIGDSLFYSRGFVILEDITTRDNIPIAGFEPGDKGTLATLKVYSMNRTSYTAQPLLIEKTGSSFSQPDTVISESLVFRIDKFEGGQAHIGVKESGAVMEYITLKAYKFPFIKVLWGGIIITAIGILMSMVHRIRQNRATRQ